MSTVLKFICYLLFTACIGSNVVAQEQEVETNPSTTDRAYIAAKEGLSTWNKHRETISSGPIFIFAKLNLQEDHPRYLNGEFKTATGSSQVYLAFSTRARARAFGESMGFPEDEPLAELPPSLVAGFLSLGIWLFDGGTPYESLFVDLSVRAEMTLRRPKYAQLGIKPWAERSNLTQIYPDNSPYAASFLRALQQIEEVEAIYVCQNPTPNNTFIYDAPLYVFALNTEELPHSKYEIIHSELYKEFRDFTPFHAAFVHTSKISEMIPYNFGPNYSKEAQ